MYGVVTRNAEELDWAEFDTGFYEVKDVTGRHTDPVPNAVNMVSCFGDTATAETDPDLVPVDADGNRATRDSTFFDWGYICPSAGHYKNGLLEVVKACADANDDVRLDDVGFPRDGYCRCDRCEDTFAESEFDDWQAWRADVITEFVEEADKRIPGKLYLTLYPDPYPGHLYERAGLDLDALSEYVDEFVVPIYDTAYGTTYWLETLCRGFRDALDIPFSVELYAVDPDVENLIHAAEVAGEYADDVYFGYHASNARAALRRMDAETRDGKEWK
ncbi:hypothetical protein [Halocalculus aciditolerans]|uniref:Glycoside hydrolase domain protein n=1 Tax=Halocalculus aciditolerans TaxID=1383812 RepID=A0A830F4B8_9EURY|nr:hypothetical protein [Halocalculus aciditolerans]GGL53848.1 hypothetical protein GCM10009039_10020 [Halocalculus aciditolerans]